MLRSRTFVRTCVGLLCAAILVMRVGGAHFHLCFDGSEPPASLHLNDDGIHHPGEGAGGVHHDLDVSLTSDVMGKKPGSDIALPALIAVPLILFIVPVVGGVPMPRRRTHFLTPAPIFRFRPPSRAPPF